MRREGGFVKLDALIGIGDKPQGKKAQIRKAEAIRDEFVEAAKNTPGAELTDSDLTLDLVRYQPHEIAGERSVRTGVFYLPEKKSRYAKYYKTGKIGYGGEMKVEGRKTFENPFIVKAATGGKGPELAYDSIDGKGSYKKMRDDVLHESGVFSAYGRGTTQEHVQRVADVIEKYGGDPSLAWDIVHASKKGNQLAYAVQEHIVASALRKAGFDGVVSYSKERGAWKLAEVFDVTQDTYPDSDFDLSKKKPETSEVPEKVAPESKANYSTPEVYRRGPGSFDVEIHDDTSGKRVAHLQIDKSTYPGAAVVKAVDVDEAHLRKGLATQMYEQAKKELIAAGITTLRGSLEGSGPVQIREKVFGPGNTKYVHGSKEVTAEEAKKIMDVDYGYVGAETTIKKGRKRK